MQQSPQVVFAAEDVAAAELQPFRYAGVDSQTSTEFKWVVWKEPAHITLVYAWTISGGVTGKSGKQRKRKAASGLGALLAALRHHHGPDDTAQLEVGTDYQEWRRVDSGSGTAEERLKAIEYLEKRLGVASGGSWNDALALQEGAKRPADDPPAGRPGKAPCRGVTGARKPSGSTPDRDAFGGCDLRQQVRACSQSCLSFTPLRTNSTSTLL